MAKLLSTFIRDGSPLLLCFYSALSSLCGLRQYSRTFNILTVPRPFSDERESVWRQLVAGPVV